MVWRSAAGRVVTAIPRRGTGEDHAPESIAVFCEVGKPPMSGEAHLDSLPFLHIDLHRSGSIPAAAALFPHSRVWAFGQMLDRRVSAQ